MKNTQELKVLAQAHHEAMLEICDNNVPVTIYDQFVPEHSGCERELPIDITVTENDTVTEIFIDHGDMIPNSVVCALNFASFFNPGGGFLNGSYAQEESLCMHSNLYEILSRQSEFYTYNKEHSGDIPGGYLNRAIYTQEVTFAKNGITRKIDVLTCACPNKSVKYLQENPEINRGLLYSRIKFILDIAEDQCVETLILGAWGCGVFKQNPEEVASIFKELLNDKRYQFTKVIFAIPSGNNNTVFKKIFHE